MKEFFRSARYSLFILSFLNSLLSCSVSHQLSKSADKILLKDSVISTGHIGISIYEPATNSYWYNYNATKYFVPCSNTKLFTLYVGMKYLGDSLIGLKYYNTDTAIYIEPTGDPTFLQDDFTKQPVFDFLKGLNTKIYITDNNWKDEALGNGWAWDDYNSSYMTERNSFPVLGNVVKITLNHSATKSQLPLLIHPSCFEKNETGLTINNTTDSISFFTIKRNGNSNEFEVRKSQSEFSEKEIPFYTNTITTAIEILKNDYNINLTSTLQSFKYTSEKIIHSQPTDSLFKPMMHRSDNFFAEQTLLMVSNEHLGYMNDDAIIDTLLKADLKDVPQKPKWVDGCGLSRYNLFTPQSFVYILNKMENEFGLERLKVILPTGGEGTLKNYYRSDSGYIYAKTGTLSNNAALSGFLYTAKKKLLIFSVLLNNFQGDAAAARIAIEKFIENIRKTH